MSANAIVGWTVGGLIAIILLVISIISSRSQNKRLKLLEQQRLVNIDETASRNKALLAELGVGTPRGFVTTFPEASELWRQSVDGYVFGLYDASVAMAVRCLELGIRRYNKAAPDARFADEIDKLEGSLSKNKDSAHSLRMMRNYIHSDRLLKKADALDALRRTAIILDELFPAPLAPTST